MKHYIFLCEILFITFCLLLCSCGQKEVKESDTTSTSHAEENHLESKSECDYSDTQNPVYRGGKVESIDTASSILGITFPSGSEIKWSYTFVTQLIDDSANFKYKPNYITCDISVPSDKKDELLKKLRSTMHEAPREEITGWFAIAECGGFISDETERYDFYYGYDACDDSRLIITCRTEATVIILKDRIAVILNDGVVRGNWDFYEPEDAIKYYYSYSLSFNRIFTVLRKEQIEGIDDIETLLNAELPDTCKLVKSETVPIMYSGPFEMQDKKYKPYSYRAKVSVESEKSEELLDILKNKACCYDPYNKNMYADDFDESYFNDISESDTVYCFIRDYNVNDFSLSFCPVYQYIYVFVGESQTLMLIYDT